MSSSILLHGGGLDSSAVFLYLLQHQVHFECVHVNYGQLAFGIENYAVNAQCRKYQVPLHTIGMQTIRALNPGPNKLFDGVSENAYIDSRNLALILRCSQIYNNADIYVGFDKPVSGVPFPDCSKEFLAAVQADYNIKVHAPLIDVDKEEVCRQALEFDSQFFDHTATCWTPNSEGECGSCKHCKIKQTMKVATCQK